MGVSDAEDADGIERGMVPAQNWSTGPDVVLWAGRSSWRGSVSFYLVIPQ